MAGEAGQDDQIIELTDVVEDEANMMDAPSDDEIIELMDLEPETVDMEDSAMLPDDAAGDDVPDDDTPAEDMPDEAVLQAVAAISPQQVEAALERVIEKQFTDKIEPLLFDTMERVILQEIKKMKKTLLKDMDQIGPF